METAHFRHLRHVYLRKIGLLALLLWLSQQAGAQVNYMELSGKKIYFGISLGINGADYKLIPAPNVVRHDSMYDFKTKVGPGFNLGIIGNLQVHKYFDIRFIPSLAFSERSIEYRMTDGTTQKKNVSAIYVDLPLEFRYKSKPIKDFRMFVMAGVRYQYDLNSNSKARKSQDLVKMKPHDFQIEYGFGFQYYFPYFILSPEFKMSHGVLDLNVKNDGLIYQRVLERMLSRAFTVTINFEG